MPHHKPQNFMNNILDDIFHPSTPICQIIRTSNKSNNEKDIFELFRPKNNTCLDYNISQTDMKLDAGNTMIHFQQTEATYVPNEKPPEEKQKKSARRKVRYFSGGPPKWEFVDEIWRRKQEEKQKVYRQQLQERLAKKGRKKNYKNK